VSLAGTGPSAVPLEERSLVGTAAVVATVEVRTPAAAAGAGRRAKRAGGVGTDSPTGSAVPPLPLGPGAIGDGAPRRGDTTGPGPVVGPTGGERVPAERGRIGGSTTTSVGRRVKRSRSRSEEGGVVV
jgi:hypothetical protein